jgi:hypothetical protein
VSAQDTATSLTGSTMAGLPATVAEHPDEAPVPAGASFAADAPAAQAGASSGPDSLVESYVDRAARLGPPHGPDCPCFMDATIRKALGHRPLIAAEPSTLVPDLLTEIAESNAVRRARRLRVSVQEYKARVAVGQRYCTGHKQWHYESAFSKSTTRSPFRCSETYREYQRFDYHRRKQEALAEVAS